MNTLIKNSQTGRLFAGCFPCGVVYADRWHEEAGDYRRLAFLPYNTLKLKIEPSCPTELFAEIRRDAAVIQAMRGKPFRVSTCGQTVMLGDKSA